MLSITKQLMPLSWSELKFVKLTGEYPKSLTQLLVSLKKKLANNPLVVAPGSGAAPLAKEEKINKTKADHFRKKDFIQVLSGLLLPFSTTFPECHSFSLGLCGAFSRSVKFRQRDKCEINVARRFLSFRDLRADAKRALLPSRRGPFPPVT